MKVVDKNSSDDNLWWRRKIRVEVPVDFVLIADEKKTGKSIRDRVPLCIRTRTTMVSLDDYQHIMKAVDEVEE